MSHTQAWKQFQDILYLHDIAPTNLCRHTHHHIHTISQVNNSDRAITLDTFEDFLDALGYEVKLKRKNRVDMAPFMDRRVKRCG